MMLGLVSLILAVQFLAVLGEHNHFAMCPSIRLNDDAVAYGDFRSEEVSDVFFIVDFFAVLHESRLHRRVQKRFLAWVILLCRGSSRVRSLL